MVYVDLFDLGGGVVPVSGDDHSVIVVGQCHKGGLVDCLMGSKKSQFFGGLPFGKLT